MAYYAKNQLTHVSNATWRVWNTYDHLGRRIKKDAQYLNSAPSTRHFIYDGWNMIAETINTAAPRHYLWGLDISGTEQGAGGVGGLLGFTLGTNWFIPLYDANGNVTGYVSANTGKPAKQFEYDAFGNITYQNGSPNIFRYRFSTKFFDHETGLCYYGYRFYDPVWGRWLNRDPIEEDGGLNLYAFCSNDGVNRWDLLGMTTIGSILDEFFSFTNHRSDLWVMGRRDEYTRIVRKWNAVQNMEILIKKDISLDPERWQRSHMTTRSWKPTKSFNPDPRYGFGKWVTSPPGTDPVTARESYEDYFWWGIESEELHISAIGSFWIAATVDDIDPSSCTATVNIWMFNEMSERSFGRFANHWYFRHRPMASQFMWWNWTEKFTFDGQGGYVDIQEEQNEW